jgi:imidazolonepropionase
VVVDFLIRNAAELFTCAGPAPRTGQAMREAGRIEDGALAADDGRIVFVGPTSECDWLISPAPSATVIDARGCAVVPGFVDAHTHVVFAGDRRHELARRLAGATYAEISAGGGGILSTVQATRAATVDELVDLTWPRLDEMLRAGTTTAEAKSGYGLTLESEVTMLRAIRRLDQEHPIDLAPTFMGAHEVPAEYRDRRAAYVAHVINDMIPEVAREGLAEWCDVFCERGVFTPEESFAILEAGRNAGLKARIHANELGPTGGATVAARLPVRSADHLVFVDDEEAAALADAGVVATLLPAAAFYLKLGRFAPARRLIDHDVAVALATDVNPGGGFSPSLPFVMSLACFAMGLTFEEALIGTTLNAAFALDRSEDVGSLEVGKRCDAVVVNGPAVELLRAGVSPIRAVVKNGRQAA